MSIKAVKFLKYNATFGKLIIAVYAPVVYVYISCACLSDRLEYNSLFAGLAVWGVRGSEQEIWL